MKDQNFAATRLLRYVWPGARPSIGESRLTTRRSTSSVRRCFRK